MKPMTGDTLRVRVRGEWVAATVGAVHGRHFTVYTTDGDVRELVVSNHQTIDQRGWDLDRVAAVRIANH